MCTNVFLPVHQHLPDLEKSVREKKQCVDGAGLKLSTMANNVSSVAISWLSILVSACCCGSNPVNLHHNAVITILKLLHRTPGTTRLAAG